MSKQEVLSTPLGEMLDMISCLAIYSGGAKEKTKADFSFEQAMALR